MPSLEAIINFWTVARFPFAAFALVLLLVFIRRKSAYLRGGDEELDKQDQSFSELSPEDRMREVMKLEEDRKLYHYKPGWIYYRCRDKGLLRELRQLQSEGRVEMATESPLQGGHTKCAQPKLTIELVPSTCWFSNLRSILKPEDWKRIKKRAYLTANYCCSICGGKGPEWPVEAHEIWLYDDSTLVQKLDRVLALCPACHEVKHIGLAAHNKRFAQAKERLKLINQWDETAADQYIDEQFEIHDSRSKKNWKVDLSKLLDYGFDREKIIALANGQPGADALAEIRDAQKEIEVSASEPKLES